MNKEDLYKILGESATSDEDKTLETIVLFLTNLKNDPDKIDWLIDCLEKIKTGAIK